MPGTNEVRKTVDVEELLDWTYRRQKADRVLNAGAGLHILEAQADGIEIHQWAGTWGLINQVATIGEIIHGQGFDPGDIAADAETVHRQVLAIPARYGALLYRHARAGTRPDWGEGVSPRFEPVWHTGPRYDEAGLPAPGSYMMIWTSKGNDIACRVRPVWPSDLVESLRDDWAAWHSGLCYLVRHFRLYPLERFDVTGPAAPASPWENERNIDDDSGVSTARVMNAL